MRASALLLLLGLAAAAQDFSEVKVERVATGYRFTEGPVWSREGFLLFSDVPNNRIVKLTPPAATSTYRDDSGAANGNTFDSKGNLYTCEGANHRITRTDPKGKVETVASQFEGKPFTAPNDIVVSKDGHIYFTDPAFGNQADSKQIPFFGVYHVTPKGEVSVVSRLQTRPNGIALSHNGRVLYVANSDERNIRAYDVDRSGTPSNERVVITGIEGVPDGIKVDEKGNIYVTCRGVAIYSSAGKLIRMIEMPETPTNCAFGDADLQSLYVTARTSLYRIRLNVKGAIQY